MGIHNFESSAEIWADLKALLGDGETFEAVKYVVSQKIDRMDSSWKERIKYLAAAYEKIKELQKWIDDIENPSIVTRVVKTMVDGAIAHGAPANEIWDNEGENQ